MLGKVYFSKERVRECLVRLVRSPKLTGDNPRDFWRQARFLNIQGGGNSQRDMLVAFSEVLEQELGFDIEACNRGDRTFIYLDDGIFTGNRVLQDLDRWISDGAPDQATVHVICIVMHRGGQYYANKNLKDAILASGKQIRLKWWCAVLLEDRKKYIDVSDVLRPTYLPEDERVLSYVRSFQHPVILRKPGHPGEAGLFSSDEGKILLEQAFLMAGLAIRELCSNLPETHRPLGYSRLETLGFGTMFISYRNCPNNTPLALWVNAPWYPLFPRITNSQAAEERLLEQWYGVNVPW